MPATEPRRRFRDLFRPRTTSHTSQPASDATPAEATAFEEPVSSPETPVLAPSPDPDAAAELPHVEMVDDFARTIYERGIIDGRGANDTLRSALAGGRMHVAAWEERVEADRELLAMVRRDMDAAIYSDDPSDLQDRLSAYDVVEVTARVQATWAGLNTTLTASAQRLLSDSGLVTTPTPRRSEEHNPEAFIVTGPMKTVRQGAPLPRRTDPAAPLHQQPRSPAGGQTSSHVRVPGKTFTQSASLAEPLPTRPQQRHGLSA